jgi:hypothetical protein
VRVAGITVGERRGHRKGRGRWLMGACKVAHVKMKGGGTGLRARNQDGSSLKKRSDAGMKK